MNENETQHTQTNGMQQKQSSEEIYSYKDIYLKIRMIPNLQNKLLPQETKRKAKPKNKNQNQVE